MSTYAAIRAVASYLPENTEPNDTTNRIIQKLGIAERHLSKEDEAASDLAVRAAETLFKNYGLASGDIDFVLLCVQHPDYQVPTTACILQDRLGIPKSAGAMDYNLGCSGYAYGLGVAKGLIETGLAHRLLLLTSSVYAKYANPKDMNMRPLFGDGATATFVEGMESDHPMLDGFVFGTDGSGFDKLIIPVGGSRHMPQMTPEVFETDTNGNIRSNYQGRMDGTAITMFSMRTVPGLVKSVLKKAGLQTADLDGCVFHQANHYMLEKLRTRCGLDEVPYYNDLTHTGNLVSGSIPHALTVIERAGKLAGRRHVLLAGFGVGLSWSGCIADFSEMLQRRA
ncbi:ketoacyl-ACP synthase III [uncultured Selenomonas sp.]|uniref:ketoacyl-ACP synthase III n=1 Tax=uncultured Selenomonas sp. TaxID=159275 RepID=UPI0025EBE5D3|nr:ketoacyl-ACP synthase III [uncultured Selenomonas sp.]